MIVRLCKIGCDGEAEWQDDDNSFGSYLRDRVKKLILDKSVICRKRIA